VFVLSLWGLLAYLNELYQYKGTELRRLLEEHFENKQLANDLLEELKAFDKKAIITMIVVMAFFGIVAAVNYCIKTHEDIKTYVTTVIFIVMVFILAKFDLGQSLKNSEKVKKYMVAV